MFYAVLWCPVSMLFSRWKSMYGTPPRVGGTKPLLAGAQEKIASDP